MENLPKFDYGGSMPLTEEEYSLRKKTIKRVWPNKVAGTGEDETFFSDEQLSAVITFHNELPSRLSDSERPGDTKSAYHALCDKLGIPIDTRDEFWKQGLIAREKAMSEGLGGWHPFPPGTVFDIRNVPGNAEIIRQRQEEIRRSLEGVLPEEINENPKGGEQ